MKKKQSTESPWYEIHGARIWNIVNEGKSFYLTASIATILISLLLTNPTALITNNFLYALALTAPLIYLFTRYDYPLSLRYILWALAFVEIIILKVSISALIASTIFISYYIFFTLIIWGTVYYRFILKEPWTTPLRFPLLVLENSDSTSGNFLEQIPKNIFTILFFYSLLESKITPPTYITTLLIIFAITIIAHRQFFKKIDSAKEPSVKLSKTKPKNPAKRAYVIVIDGCNLDQFKKAKTPVMDSLAKEGTVYKKMKTIYPARTVVCFSSMLTGLPKEKTGIKSNLVLKPHRLPVTTIFDRLKDHKKKGKLIAIAHLLDVFPENTYSVCSLMPNSTADTTIMNIAKDITKKEDPALLVTQLISVDQTGHARGCFTKDYIRAIENVDMLIGDFINYLKKEKKLKDSIILIMADHGQSKGIGGHGHWDKGEKYVPFILCGKNIQKGKTINEEHNILSVTPIIRNALKI